MKLNQTLGIVGLAVLVSVGANATMIKTNDAVIKVDAGGLDLGSERGQEILYHRLQNAAKQICGSTNLNRVGSVARVLSNKSCYKETLDEAVKSVGVRGLEVLHRRSS